MPKNETGRPEPVSPKTVAAITAALPSWARVAVPFALGAGLRQGEATGLAVDRVEFLRRTLRVDRQLVTRQSAAPQLGPAKTQRSNRTVPLAEFVADAVSAHLAEHGSGDHGLILHLEDGRPIGRNRFGRIWRKARETVGAEHVDYHDLRHTFASTLLSEGVSVRAVADWMGHASPSVTLDTYAHVMPVDEDRARSVLDQAARGVHADDRGGDRIMTDRQKELISFGVVVAVTLIVIGWVWVRPWWQDRGPSQTEINLQQSWDQADAGARLRQCRTFESITSTEIRDFYSERCVAEDLEELGLKFITAGWAELAPDQRVGFCQQFRTDPRDVYERFVQAAEDDFDVATALPFTTFRDFYEDEC